MGGGIDCLAGVVLGVAGTGVATFTDGTAEEGPATLSDGTEASTDVIASGLGPLEALLDEGTLVAASGCGSCCTGGTLGRIAFSCAVAPAFLAARAIFFCAFFDLLVTSAGGAASAESPLVGGAGGAGEGASEDAFELPCARFFPFAFAFPFPARPGMLRYIVLGGAGTAAGTGCCAGAGEFEEDASNAGSGGTGSCTAGRLSWLGLTCA